MRFLPWSLPRVGNGGGKRQVGTPGHLSDPGGKFGRRVRLTRKTRPGACHSRSRASNVEEMEKIAPPSSEGEGGEPSEGIGVGFFSAGQSSRRGWCWHQPGLIRCMSARDWTDTRVLHHVRTITITTTTTPSPSQPQPQPQPQPHTFNHKTTTNNNNNRRLSQACPFLVRVPFL